MAWQLTATQEPEQKSSASLSVSEALGRAKAQLEDMTLVVEGEVSQFKDSPGYKAVYFTVKDEKASLPCMMWMNRYQASGVALSVGALVELTGRFSLYAAKGRMNFDVFSVSLAGEGQLRLQVANLARELEAMGLMDPARKRPLPAYPEAIGLVTSPRGAAVHDVLRTLRRRYPLARILFAGVPVEGPGAADGLVDGLAKVVFAGAEVVLLVRGGGSFEDLMPFNDEQLARAIVKCPIPVVTGIGHEPDTTIADLVGDLRASTPTGAAEAVTVQTSQLAAQLRSMGEYIAQRQQQRIQHAALSLDRYATRPIFKDPRSMFASDLITLDMAHDRLSRALPANIERDKTHLAAYASRLSIKPAIFDRASAKLENYSSRLLSSTASLDRDTLRLSAQCDRLREVSSKLLTPAQHEVALKAGRLHDYRHLQRFPAATQ